MMKKIILGLLSGLSLTFIPRVLACGLGHDEASEVIGVTGNVIGNGMMGNMGFTGGVIVALLIVVIILGILNLYNKGGNK